MVWCGLEPIGDRDGRLALYLTDQLSRAAPRHRSGVICSPRAGGILSHLETEGASFFAALHEAGGSGFPGDTVDALWDLVWRGLLTNDTFHALRAFTRTAGPPSAEAGSAPHLPQPASRPTIG